MVLSRRVDEFSVIVLAFLAVGVVTSSIFSDPRLFLVEESVETALFGLILLGAPAVAPHPLMFYFGRRFATGGAPARIQWWNGLWRYAGFRRTQVVLTAVWGIVLLRFQLAVAAPKPHEWLAQRPTLRCRWAG
ncbi:hypothetical protein EV383_4897 [Pseudonocardia sediminis]|uniref:Uncharacterized protein n=1 Tax=Pseudonocardia sediminis TaxID=1397368 RepID=A0A4Q7V5C7_PSEST|nr:VC0807 family protein [Pseudonocardia sediminis]RZT87963.1 hypothetical protein EV383_4897 [Pseudonocardia sediminis]